MSLPTSGRVSPSLSISVSTSTQLLPDSVVQPHSPSSTSSTRSLSSASFSSRGFHPHGTLPMPNASTLSASGHLNHSAPASARRSNSPHSFSDGTRSNLTTSAEKDEEDEETDEAKDELLDSVEENRRLAKLSSTGGIDASDEDEEDNAAPVHAKTHSRQTSIGDRLNASRSKSRTLPNSKTKKRSLTIANRLKTFLSQQKSDGLYCVLTMVNDPIAHLLEAREKEKAKSAAEELLKKSAASEAENESESNSSESSTESETESELSEVENNEENQLSSKERRQLRKQRQIDEIKRKEEIKEVAALRARFHSVFVLNKMGGIFGKQPGIDQPQSEFALTTKKHYLLSDPFVSKKHFKVDADKGRFFISDLGSLNGSFIRRNFSSANGSGSRVMKSIADQNQGVTVRHEKPYGYRLTNRRVFVLGKGELMVAQVCDAESADGEVAESDYSVVIQFTARSIPGADSKIRSVKVGIGGARLGRSDECEILIADQTIDEVQSRIFFLEGKFYLKDVRDDCEVGVWARLSLKGEESSPHLLCSGDMIRIGVTEMKVAVRAIPPASGGGFGIATGVIAPVLISNNDECSFEIGSTLEGNFTIQKEMQDRLVAIKNYGGNERNGFFAVFDGHQDRSVADFAAASFHHNLLEEIDSLVKQSDSASGSVESREDEEFSPHRKALHDDLYDGESRITSPTSRIMRLSLDETNAYEPEDTPSASSAQTPRSAGQKFFSSAPLIQTPAHATQLDLKAALRNAYLKTTAQIVGMGDAANYGGCTAVTCLLWYFPATRERRLLAGNLGDSRAVLCRGGKPVDLTYIHIGRDEGEQKRVKEVGGKIAPNNRLAGCLEVTRAFGDLGMVPFGLSSEPFIREVVIQPNDSYLIVSSDGLFDVLSSVEVCEILNAQPPDVNAQQLSSILIETALTKKTRDNMSIVVIDLNPQIRQQAMAEAGNELQTPARVKPTISTPTMPPVDAKDSVHSPLELRTPNEKPIALVFPSTAPAQSRNTDSPPVASEPRTIVSPFLRSSSAIQLDQNQI